MTGSLNLLDAVIIVIGFLSIFLGIIKGFVRELLSLAFFILAVILAFLFYQDMGNILAKYIKDKDVSHFAGFTIVFTIVMIVGAIVTYFVKKVFVIGPMKPIDRILGGTFGLVRGVAIAGVIVFGLIAFPIDDRLIKESQLSPYVTKTIRVFYNLLPEKYKEKINFIDKSKSKNDRQKNN
jgi:membrane protein required for colicin V production